MELTGARDLLGSVYEPSVLAIRVEQECELGGDDQPIAKRCEGLTDKLLVDERTVDLCGSRSGPSL